MSVDLIVYLPRASMPSPKKWAEAIIDAGFPVEMEAAFDPDTATGFRPCRFAGVPSGFEYYSSRLSEREQHELGVPQGCDFSVNLLTHADLREFATALISGSILCQLSDGLLVDPQAGERYSASEVLPWARQQLASIENELR